MGLASRVLVLACAFSLSAAHGDEQGREDQEPPLRFTLTVDGRSMEVEPGVSVMIGGELANPVLRLSAAAKRHFRYGGASFDYPGYFLWEASVSDPSARTWRLKGNDVTITYMVLEADVSAAALADGMAKQLGAENCRRLWHGRFQFLRLGFEALRLRVVLLDSVSWFDVVALPADRRGRSRLLTFKDSPPEGGAQSDEADAALSMLRATFRLTE